ncbi:hypothetical protein QAD02_019524 [Eretmocerus hayati]|uniref:Uncharacterized protein n=1 Tax=Eretmocerus hayati TaxID=131215 RepID=A0ACC2PJT8_9HYME|nr:hypothetical protein QAD02_019524 [Eretmocerus hayati]
MERLREGLDQFVFQAFAQVFAHHQFHHEHSDEEESISDDDDDESEQSDESIDESSDDEDSNEQELDKEKCEEKFNERQRTRLFFAIAKGNLEQVTKLIDDGADVDAIQDGIPLLHWAVMNNRLPILSALLKAGASPNTLDKNSQSALQRAVIRKNVAIFKALLDAKADIHYKGGEYNDKKESILHKAVNIGETEMAKSLLEHGADVNAKNSQGKSVLLYAASRMRDEPRVTDEEHVSILDLLISHGAKALRDGPEGESSSFETVLRYGTVSAVQLFLQNGINLKDIRAKPLLHLALKNKKSKDSKVPNNPDVLKFLLDTDIFDIEKKNADGCSVLLQAIEDTKMGGSDNARVELLLRYGANPNTPDKNKRLPLNAAVDRVQVASARLLLEYGAHLDDKICKNILSSVDFWKHRIQGSRLEDISNKMYELLIAQIAVRESQNWKDTPDIFEIAELLPEGHDYYKACQEELTLLKKFIIHKSLSLYNILASGNIYRHVDNKHVVKAFKDQDVIKKFPKYGYQIGRRLVRLREKHKLMLQAMGSLGRVLKFDVNALHIIAYNILGRLEKNDLRNLSRV